MYIYTNICTNIYTLIGMHGAGFGNQIYMKPNSAIVEFCPYPNDGRCLLGMVYVWRFYTNMIRYVKWI
jgi:hypothetical protein